MLSKINIANYNSIVLYSKNWDSGILGIVSAKIASEFNKPTILFSEVEDELKGSARSMTYKLIDMQRQKERIFTIPKSKEIFNMVEYDTLDFPDAIEMKFNKI